MCAVGDADMSETGSGWSVGNSCDPVTAGGQDWKPSGNSFCREHFGHVRHCPGHMVDHVIESKM